MILAAAVALGLVVSLARHRRGALQRLASLQLDSAWLVLIALALQWPLLRARAAFPGEVRVEQVLFLGSYLFLFAFVGRNWRLVSILIVGVGAVCNALVIAANGGFMPITPETLARINPGSTVEQWTEGMHYAGSKDIVRTAADTRLWPLSDVLVLPPPFPWPTAFSAGDVVIAGGIVALIQAPGWRLNRRREHEP